jgi:DNA helicase-2/ATP-dependent DNA helicase PcrA
LYDDARSADTAQLQQIAVGYRSRERFLTELTLDSPDATSGRARATLLDEDYTILSTIHSAKGGEWKIVRVLNVVDGCIPLAKATRTSDEIEEERRLLHVAMTRPKDELDLIVPQRLFMYQQNGHESGHVYASISRFIRKSIHHAFEAKHWNERPNDSISGRSRCAGAHFPATFPKPSTNFTNSLPSFFAFVSGLWLKNRCGAT